MSRLGKRPIGIPKGIKVAIENGIVKVEGTKGKLDYTLPGGVNVEIKDDNVIVTRKSDSKTHRSLHGLVRALISNMIEGTNSGYSKELEIRGVGYKAQVSEKKLVMNLGYSHPVEFPVPEGITITAPKPTHLVISGIDKGLVGTVAAKLRAIDPPEVYKGKGIRYVGEYVRQKAGKTVA